MVELTREEAHREVHRYCAGRMAATEQEEFEDRMIGDAWLAEQVDLTLRLRAGLRDLESRGELNRLLDQRIRSGLLPLAAAAMVLVALAGVLLYRRLHTTDLTIATSLTELAATAGESPQLGTYLLASTRGAAREQDIRVPRDVRGVLLRALPDEPLRSGRYRVEMRFLDGDARASRAPVLTDSEGLVLIYLDARKIAAGSYEIVLRPADASEVGGETLYRIHLSFAN